jgi:signal transduction histidine kinase
MSQGQNLKPVDFYALIHNGLGRVNILNLQLLILLSLILFMTDFGYELQRRPDLFPMAILDSVISIALFLVVLIFGYLIVRSLSTDDSRAIGLLVTTSLAAVVKSLVLMLLLHGSEYLAYFTERIPGDLTIAGLYIVVTAAMFSAYNNHLQVAEELERVSVRLAEQKNTRIEVASEVEAELQQKANAALGAELDRISTASQKVLDAVESSSLKLQIQALVRNQVRPLSRELQARVQILRSISSPSSDTIRSRNLLALKLKPRIDTSFIASYVIAIPNIFLTVLSKSDLQASLLVLGASLSYPLLGRFFQLFLSRRSIPISYGINLPAVVSVLAYLPTGLVIYFIGLQFELVDLTTLTAGGVLLFTCVASTAWFALQRTRDENAGEILSVNAEIRHELDLLDQAVWVAQRKWSYIIHGTVQGALTVASSRLEMASKLDDKLKESVRSDIERAKSVLTNPPSFDRPVRELLTEIADTWQGVCEFEFQIAPSADVALSKNLTSTTCLVEIAKELISNANRHGGASKFWLNAYLRPDGDLEIVAGNNGKTISTSSGSGLGYEMISQLTKDWNLGGGTTNSFSAVLPMPRN